MLKNRISSISARTLPHELKLRSQADRREMSELELESVSGGEALKNLALRIGNALCRDSSSSAYTQDEPGGFITGITVTVNNSFNSTVTAY